MNPFSRFELLAGTDALDRLAAKRVAVFGLGGVGGHAAESLVRSGIGTIDLIDNDTVSVTNVNRQLIALHSTVGLPKTQVMAERLRDINPQVRIYTHDVFFLPENASNFDFAAYDYVVDAVDTVTAKIEIIARCVATDTPVISAMGTGNKWDPSQLQVADLSKTSMCPLARVMRKELGVRGIKHIPVVFSTEAPQTPHGEVEEATVRRSIPASTAFVPAAAGLLMASKVVRDLLDAQ